MCRHAAVRLRAFNSSLSQNAGSTVANNVQGVGRVSKAFFIHGNCHFKKMTGKQSAGGEACLPGDVRYELASQICVFMNRDRLLRHRDKRSLWIHCVFITMFYILFFFPARW